MLLLLLACAPASIQVDEVPDDPAGTPDIAVDVTLIDFGSVRPGESASQVITVTNEGDADLHLDVPVLLDPTGSFALAAVGAQALLPGESASVVVSFAPTASGTPTASLLIVSDDPDEADAEVMLLGAAVDPAIAVAPSSMDYGQVFLGCADVQGFTVTNEGEVDLTVIGVEIAGGDATFTVDVDEATNGPLPWTLAPLESRVVWTTFTPERDTTYSGSLVIYSDDPENPSAGAGLDGGGTASLSVTEDYVASGGSWDIVVAVDPSDSFDSERGEIPDALADFADSLDSVAIDYQLAEVMDAGGCVEGGDWIYDGEAASSQLTALEDMLDVSDLDETMHGLDLLSAAVDEDRIGSGECNEGLLREDSNLLLLGLTDGGERTYDGWSDYEAQFDALGNEYLLGYIGQEHSCGGSYAGVGTEWQEGARDTDGPALSLCDDWADNFDSIVESMATPQTKYPLSGEPQEETIVVYIDGEVASGGWWYAPYQSAVMFSDNAAPALGASVTITYDAAPECD